MHSSPLSNSETFSSSQKETLCPLSSQSPFPSAPSPGNHNLCPLIGVVRPFAVNAVIMFLRSAFYYLFSVLPFLLLSHFLFLPPFGFFEYCLVFYFSLPIGGCICICISFYNTFHGCSRDYSIHIFHSLLTVNILSFLVNYRNLIVVEFFFLSPLFVVMPILHWPKSSFGFFKEKLKLFSQPNTSKYIKTPSEKCYNFCFQ